MYSDFVANLDALEPSYPLPLRAYLVPTVHKIQLWVQALREKASAFADYLC
jgi:hypothetical protein